jgi:hypothetical protein
LIYIYKIFSSSSSRERKMVWFQGSSEKWTISLLQIFCGLCLIYIVRGYSLAHIFSKVLSSLKTWNLGTLEPDIEKALQIKHLHGSNISQKTRFTGTWNAK